MEVIKYALIGFGGIAENRLAKEGFALDEERFEAANGFRLLGATDVDKERRSAVDFLGVKWYDSAEEIFSDVDIDAVVIATNNGSHFELGKMALESGKHCLIEKPLATTLEDACELKQIARKRGCALSVDHMMTCNDYNIKARKLALDGSLGKVNDLRLHMEFFYGSTPEERASWRCASPEELGGPIGDVGSHCLYMAEFLADSKIREISVVYHPRTMNIAVENGALMKFVMRNGIVGEASVSFASPRGGTVGTLSNLGFEIYGSEGVCRSYGTMFQFSGHADEPVRLRLEIDSGRTLETIGISDPGNIYQRMIGAHADAVRGGMGGNVDSAIHNLKLLVAALESAENGGIAISVDSLTGGQ